MSLASGITVAYTAAMLPRLAALVLVATVSIANGDAPHPLPRPVLIHDLATLTHAAAMRPAGTTALYRVEVDSRAEEHEGRVMVDNTSPDAVHRTVRLVPPVVVRETMTVRARLRVVRRPASWGFPELVECRLEDGARRQPGLVPGLFVAQHLSVRQVLRHTPFHHRGAVRVQRDNLPVLTGQRRCHYNVADRRRCGG